MGDKGSYHRSIDSTPYQTLPGRDMILNLASVVEMQVITAKNKQQFDIDIANENTKQVGFDYNTGYLVYVYKIGIYYKLW